MNVLTGDIQLMSTIIDSKCTLTATCSEHTVSSSIDNHSISLVCYSNEDEDNHTKDKCKPTLLLGYGSYGICLPMSYRVDYSVLLSQGWRIAFAQVRYIHIILYTQYINIFITWVTLYTLMYLCTTQRWWRARKISP
jgi:hypothetical protein